jgi:dihydrofolate synthase/folylpolyglutamate synthase
MKQQIIDELTTKSNINITPGLDRIKILLNYLGNPQNNYKVIHITGSNGKGSTAAFIEAGLIHAKYKVGKYTSPHIYAINETITLNGVAISDNILEDTFIYVKNIVNIHNLLASPFELLTAIMFYFFSKNGIEYLVLEVGMGGENDATNVILNPVYCIITNIALEHTNWLGNSLKDIAKEKTGIIKNNTPTVFADNSIELLVQIKKRTNYYTNILDKYLGSIVLDFINFKTILAINLEVSPLGSKDLMEIYSLNLFGKFQAYNFLCAYEVLSGLNIAAESIRYAAESAKWHGRLERIAINPEIIVDATHNESGAKVLYDTLAINYIPEDVVVITSILADKNIPAMLGYLNQISSTIIFTSITTTSRGLEASKLYDIYQSSGMIEDHASINTICYSIEDPLAALEFAKTLNKKLILITGSLYLIKHYRSIP